MSENLAIMVSEGTLKARLEEEHAFVENEIKRINDEIAQSRDSIRNLGLLNKKTVDDIKGVYQAQVDDVIRRCKDRIEAEESKIHELIDKISITTLSRHFAAKSKIAKQSANNFLRSFYLVAACAFIFGIFVVYLTWGWVEDDAPFLATLKFIALRFFVYVPVYFPLVWLMTHLNRWAAKKNRLAEEYDHKRVVSETYIGMADELEDLVQKGVRSSSVLLEKLINGTIDVICCNPGDKAESIKVATPINAVADNLTKVADAVTSVKDAAR